MGANEGLKAQQNHIDPIPAIYALKQQGIAILDDELAVVLASDGALYMSVPTICIALGINIRAQLRRIQRTVKLAPGLRHLVLQTRGGPQRSNCLTLREIPVWLAGIRLDLTQKQMRQKLEVYQQELVRQASAAFPLTPLFVGDHQVPDRFIPYLMRNIESVDEQIINDRPPIDRTVLVDFSIGSTSTHMVGPRNEERTTFQKRDAPHERPRSTEQTLLAQIPPHDLYSHLLVTSCEEDTAFRESCLAKEQRWTMVEEPYYTASNQIQVFLDYPECHIEPAKARQQIRNMGVSTISTGRIALGLWHFRWKDGRLSENGYAVIDVKEILAWRGIQKHARIVSPNSSARISIDYESKFLERVCQDFNVLRQCYLRRQYHAFVNGKQRQFSMTSQYMHISMIMEGNASSNSQSVAGFLVKPGDWFATYPGREINKFAEVDRRIFSLDPRRDFLAACIAFYLVERWHALANRVSLEESEKDLFQPYRVPIAMRDLLAASMIEIDKINLTSRFVGRIEAALNKLFERHILAEQPVCLSSINKSGYWGRDWLASLWQLLPTLEMADAYQQAIRQKHVRRDGTSD